MNPFEGLTLSDTQKAQLQQLNAQRKADRQQMAQTRKDNKQRNDSARIAERRAAKKSYLEQVKAIIGPDQYVVFLENMYVNGGAQGHGKAFKKGDRSDKQGFAKDRQSKDKRHKGDRKHASNRTTATQAQTQS